LKNNIPVFWEDERTEIVSLKHIIKNVKARCKKWKGNEKKK